MEFLRTDDKTIYWRFNQPEYLAQLAAAVRDFNPEVNVSFTARGLSLNIMHLQISMLLLEYEHDHDKDDDTHQYLFRSEDDEEVLGINFEVLGKVLQVGRSSRVVELAYDNRQSNHLLVAFPESRLKYEMALMDIEAEVHHPNDLSLSAGIMLPTAEWKNFIHSARMGGDVLHFQYTPAATPAPAAIDIETEKSAETIVQVKRHFIHQPPECYLNPDHIENLEPAEEAFALPIKLKLVELMLKVPSKHVTLLVGNPQEGPFLFLPDSSDHPEFSIRGFVAPNIANPTDH